MKILKKILKFFLIILGVYFLVFIGLTLSGDLPEIDSEDINSTKVEDSKLAERQKEIADSIQDLKAKNRLIALNKLKSFRKKSDEFEEAEFYSHKSTPIYVNRNFIYPYIVKKDGNFWLRLKMQYSSKNWLFIEKATFLVDGLKFDVNGVWERDNNSSIWEWKDIAVDDDKISLLNLIANSKVTKVRYTGQKYYKDRVLTKNEKSIIKNTIGVFKDLN